ncbi:MAG: MATE family efflux transporter [Calditrichaeota bacterium]|nr:MATE family efflux transporter [Calditrichota bacterium]
MNQTDKRSRALGEERIAPLLFRLSVPATVGMLAMSLYNVVDTIFVGRGLGALAIAGISIVMPIQMLIFSSAQTLGIGAASIISRRLGARDLPGAENAFGNVILLTLGVSALIVFLGYLFADELLFLFGSQGEMVPYARDYFLYILAGTPFLIFDMVFNNVNRAEGNVKIAMITMIIAAVLNIIFDPIFIFGFGLGVKGAAIASDLSQFLTLLFLIYYFYSGRSILKFRLKYFKPNFSIIREILAIGASSFARHGAASVLAAILNHSLFIFGSELAVAIYGIINRILRMTFMPLFGLLQAFLPIIGYNYGAKNYERVRKTLHLSVKYATLIVLFIFSALMIFAGPIFSIFSKNAQLIAEGSRALRIILLLTPLIGLQVIGAGYFQALGKALPAFILAIARQILFLLPLILVLPLFFRLNGIWMAFPLADFLSVCVTLLMVLPEWRRLTKKTKTTNPDG